MNVFDFTDRPDTTGLFGFLAKATKVGKAESSILDNILIVLRPGQLVEYLLRNFRIKNLLIVCSKSDENEDEFEWPSIENTEITSLSFTNEFSGPIPDNFLPTGLQKLSFLGSNKLGDNGINLISNFNHKLSNLPPTLKVLVLGTNYSQSFDRGELPAGAKSIIIGAEFPRMSLVNIDHATIFMVSMRHLEWQDYTYIGSEYNAKEKILSLPSVASHGRPYVADVFDMPGVHAVDILS